MDSHSEEDANHPPKCTFYDMKHSNNAARIRLWIRLKHLNDDDIDIVMLTHQDIESEEYHKINPLKKVPAMITETGLHLFEASVILQYLEDKFSDRNAPQNNLILETSPEDRARVHLVVRCHDLYIASPNCTQPNFSHTQGCMYLDPTPTRFTPSKRTMSAAIRAAKLAELYQQLCWLEDTAQLPYLLGDTMTHADITWFPTAVFMELLLPKVFDWKPVFHERDVSESFPKLSKWFQTCLTNGQYAKTREEIKGTLMLHAENGRFVGVKENVVAHPEYKWKYT